MMRKSASAFKQPYYLWLLGVYPILHLYRENFGLVNDHDVALVALAALVTTTLAFMLTKRLFPDEHARAFILAMWSLLFSLSGHLFLAIFNPSSLTVWTVGLILLGVMLTRILNRPKLAGSFSRLTATLNIIATVLLALQLAQLAPLITEDLRAESFADALLAAHAGRPAAEKALNSPQLPDIYYIIPDAYPSDAWHLEAMNFDNSAFTAELEALGFQVAAHAQSNYSATRLSLPSTLNMRYMNSNPTALSDLHYLRLAVNNSEVARYLLRRGYTYVQLRTGSIGPSPIADINKQFTKQGYIDLRHANFEQSLHLLLDAEEGFAALYIDTTLLRTVKSQLSKLARLAPAADVEEPGFSDSIRFLSSLAELEGIAQMPEATFTIVHLEKPHRPVHFNREGEFIGEFHRPSPEQYFDELHFINQRMLATITRLIAAAPHETVIILQADHGSTYGTFAHKNRDNTYFHIYAAYYLPPGFELEFPKPFTLINSFPVLLNALFDADFALQEDKFFTLQTGYDDPLNQHDVTQMWLQGAST